MARLGRRTARIPQEIAPEGATCWTEPWRLVARDGVLVPWGLSRPRRHSITFRDRSAGSDSIHGNQGLQRTGARFDAGPPVDFPPHEKPQDFFKPLAIGAPEPLREIPVKPSRMIHFFDASNEKMAPKVPDMAKQADILLGNLEDAVPADRKVAAREGLVKRRQGGRLRRHPALDPGQRLESPWVLDDLTTLVTEIGTSST